ncbi:hypothetical protein SBOR_0163 [Sclerotinia borealis F-4128]|uniref:Uncharacterized protein n=1 Tax=Sclerotinia borealis (strain F-4128) TaxID=1432307 RepID=W9CU52_SCLBF|nr:hypothetical protein SBOR_0163 [Sclerotinia borealis F-4128]
MPRRKLSPSDRLRKFKLRQHNIAEVPGHQFIDYDAGKSALRIMLDFANVYSLSGKEIIYDNLIKILPKHANHTSTVYLGLVFEPRHTDYSAYNESRRGILERVVEEINKFQHLVEVHFVLHLHYLVFDQIRPASAIYGLNFQSWTFDILTDDVAHIEHDSAIDRLLKPQSYQCPLIFSKKPGILPGAGEEA